MSLYPGILLSFDTKGEPSGAKKSWLDFLRLTCKAKGERNDVYKVLAALLFGLVPPTLPGLHGGKQEKGRERKRDGTDEMAPAKV